VHRGKTNVETASIMFLKPREKRGLCATQLEAVNQMQHPYFPFSGYHFAFAL
jgi:hypothetical protein